MTPKGRAAAKKLLYSTASTRCRASLRPAAVTQLTTSALTAKLIALGHADDETVAIVQQRVCYERRAG